MKLPFFKKKAPEKKFQDTLKKYHEAAEQTPGDIRFRIKIAELYLENDKKDKRVCRFIGCYFAGIRKDGKSSRICEEGLV